MKPIFLLLAFLLSQFLIQAQKKRQISIDTGWAKVNSNIYRILLMQPLRPDYETDGIIAGNYEHKLINNFSMVTKIGIGAANDNFGPIENRRRTSFHLYAALEARYYFSLYRRIRKGRGVLNYSGPYLALEQNIITNYIALINKPSKSSLIGQSATYINIGYQKQWGKFYLFGFFGVPLFGHRFSKTIDQNISLHGGTGIGYVF